tara:strand:+ start:1067 stop:1420 length:354 start_codon:yes stop_codon:yes gene_type:complete
MNKLITITLLILLLAIPLINQDKDTRYENWSSNILCPVCQGETIYDSPSEYAEDMRIILREQIDSGLSDDEIYNYWVIRYGERIITNPQRRNLEMIVLPIILISLFILGFMRSTKDE